ncbi:MAG: AAA family ATPase [Candidatus Harrisonbacteria bacterium]|nr:AAA family ATPase [Candidatus Harrisonbacteria bacterium]
MYLKRLELSGFKSFANKTVFEFPTGVTAIVGPNGSGKSNVIDGLRWILGESSSKSMRAERAEHLIFSGSANKGGSSLAQVSVVFDNSSKLFDFDYDEVVIRRRLTKDGGSKYFLNDSEVRLKDIVGMFSTARLGTKGLTIINQGSSDIFIRSNITERRQMMEEILGLRQYQIKRHDAENKLKNTRINLEKVSSLIQELLPHLRFLRKQSKKYQRHQELKDQLRALESAYFSARRFDLEQQSRQSRKEAQGIEEKMRGVRGELEGRQTELEKIEDSATVDTKEDTSHLEEKRRQIQEQRIELTRELARIELQIEIASKESPKGSASYDELLALVKESKILIDSIGSESDLTASITKLKDLGAKIEGLLLGKNKENEQKVPAELIKKQGSIAEKIKDLETQMAELDGKVQKAQSAQEGFTGLFKKAFSRVQESEQALHSFESELNKIALGAEKIKFEQEQLHRQLKESERSLSEFSPREMSGMDFSQKEREMMSLRHELASIGEIDQTLLKEAQETESRYEYLSSQSEDLEKAAKDLEKLIVELKQTLQKEFATSLKKVNEAFDHYFKLMFSGGSALLRLIKPIKVKGEDEEAAEEEEKDQYEEQGLDISVSIPRKNIKGLDMLSGGERSLVSIAVLFALISVSPPPFLVLDEVDAALDENNTKRFASLIREFSSQTQFIIVTHNRASMGEADVLYGVTMSADGSSRVLSLKLEEAKDISVT